METITHKLKPVLSENCEFENLIEENYWVDFPAFSAVQDPNPTNKSH